MLTALRRRGRRLWHCRRASVSVEFAIVSLLFLLPLLVGSADMIDMISAQAQLNAASQALYSYAWANPTNAASTANLKAVLALLNDQEFHQLSLASSSVAYNCIDNNAATPTYASVNSISGQCQSNQTQQVVVSYQVKSTVNLPVPIPFIAGNGSLTLTSGGSAQVQ
jgi:Flp pilus assembly protein TadG